MKFASERRTALLQMTSALGGMFLPSITDASTELIKVGQTSAYTGPFGDNGSEISAGIKAYFDWINQRGGVKGKKIKWIAMDDRLDPKKAIENTKKLVEDEKVVAMLGCLGTGVANALMPYCEDKKIPYVPITGDDVIRQKKQKYTFFTTASYGDETRSMVKHAATVALQSIFVVHTDTSGGKGWAEDAREAAQKNNVKFLGTFAAKPDGSNAVEAVEICLKANPAAVLLLLAGDAVQKTLEQLKSKSYLGQKYALSVAVTPKLMQEMGPSVHGLIVTQVVPNPFFDASPVVREYRAVIENSKNVQRNYLTFQGYLTARLFSDSVSRVNGPVSSAALVAALEQRPFSYEPLELDFTSGERRGTNFVNITMLSKNLKFIS
jgi:branched-chain amino acid transport system substrate-binding protein